MSCFRPLVAQKRGETYGEFLERHIRLAHPLCQAQIHDRFWRGSDEEHACGHTLYDFLRTVVDIVSQENARRSKAVITRTLNVIW